MEGSQDASVVNRNRLASGLTRHVSITRRRRRPPSQMKGGPHEVRSSSVEALIRDSFGNVFLPIQLSAGDAGACSSASSDVR